MKRPVAALITVAAILAGGCMIGADSKPGPRLEKRSQSPVVTAADEIAARGRLLAISTAEFGYQAMNDGEFATMDELIAKGALNDPSHGKLARYRFEVRIKSQGFEATAVPEKYSVTGNQSFYIDETRIMRGADKGGAKADASDPAL